MILFIIFFFLKIFVIQSHVIIEMKYRLHASMNVTVLLFLQSPGEHNIESNTVYCDDATRTITSNNKSLGIAHKRRRKKATESHTNV